MRNLLLFSTTIIILCLSPLQIVSATTQEIGTRTLLLCKNKTDSFDKFIQLATWRQCEDSTACGTDQHCCEIAGGESRCYASTTLCP
jgi:hypothetical protein